MAKRKKSSDRDEAINRLAAEASLPDVAEWLGLQVVGRGTSTPKTLCPFHDDHRPSMQLYPASSGGRPQFHCFSCGAHGDVFALIKRVRNGDFRDALEWVAERCRVTLPTGAGPVRDERLSPRVRGLELGLTIFGRQTARETKALRRFAAERNMEMTFLQTAEVFAVFPRKIAISKASAEREQLDALETAGLVRLDAVPRTGDSLALPLSIPRQDFFRSPRIIFTVRDDRGGITGFAGRG